MYVNILAITNHILFWQELIPASLLRHISVFSTVFWVWAGAGWWPWPVSILALEIKTDSWSQAPWRLSVRLRVRPYRHRGLDDYKSSQARVWLEIEDSGDIRSDPIQSLCFVECKKKFMIMNVMTSFFILILCYICISDISVVRILWLL